MPNMLEPILDPWYIRIYKFILIFIFIYIPIIIMVFIIVASLAGCILLPIVGILWLCGVI